MNTLGMWLIACSLPVTLFTLAGVVVYAVARRRSPAAGALTAVTTLVMLFGISLLAASSWPQWWTFAMPIGSSSVPAPTVATDAVVETAAAGSSFVNKELTRNVSAPFGAAEDVSFRPMATIDPTEQPLLSDMFANHDRMANTVSTWRWQGIVGLIFVTGASLAAVRFLLGLWMVHRYRVRSVVITASGLAEQVRQIARDLGVTRSVELRQSHTLGSPATVGWRRPLVLLPSGWEAWSDEERRVVLAHEIAHIARGDYLTWLLAQVSLALHFYHPLVHWLVRRLRLEQELAADVLGADLAGGREFYLITLTRMVLRQDSQRTSWAAQPFLPHRGTFLRRIEMLSEHKTLRPVPWSRGSAAIFVMAMACFGLAIAGVRVSLAEPSATTANSEDRPRPEADRKPDAVAAKPTDKPLTLAELQPIVMKQIQSIRSLHVSYTKIEPFGGKPTDHIWAEQGPKMLGRDIPEKNSTAYSVSFDGKQTYRVVYLGDQPTVREAGAQYAPEVYNSLHTSILGWLHPRSNSEPLVAAILAPTAKIVDPGTAAGSPGPTIEVQNYGKPDSKYPLNVTIVLDRAHGYFPRSIAFHAAATPTWRFIYEFDKFQTVRDAASGKDRWFPMRGTYKQKTPEHGEQTFTTTINKIQINEKLPDEMFVLPGDELPPAA
ncbi:MAG: antirepressor regulating drug resistance protein, partial [Planctomycetaceae bacterium]|nr:antirepressor regulating drug resistance protein [Planctomycetaceae bacterium]